MNKQSKPDSAPDANQEPDAPAEPVPVEGNQPQPDAGAPSELDLAKAEIAALKEKMLRARADYDNLVKRQQRDAALERERVKARVLENFLQVYEYGRMAATEAEKHPGALAEGVKMIVREFDRMLEGEGVKMLGTVGEAFDASIHEAIGEEETAGVEAGMVSRVVQPGYRLGERVLRYAKVTVAPKDSPTPS